MEPLVFEPYLRPMVWGERRLGTKLGKKLPGEGTFGESWEVSSHRSHVSLVAEGPLAGTSLADLCAKHPIDFYGYEGGPAAFPLLIKLLDAHDWLSVQVHPDDKLAAELTPGEGGKTEAWVILHAEPGSKIWAGLKPGTTPEDLKRHLEAGTVVECLHELTPKVGDCLFFRAGTVHAVGGGVLFAEVQQTSDATFRLFDWNRVQPDGTRRKLHIEESLAAINWDFGPVNPAKPWHLERMVRGAVGEGLVKCPFFSFDRLTYTQAGMLPPTGHLSICMVLSGLGELTTPKGYSRVFRTGETVVIPAAVADITKGLSWRPIDGPMSFLWVRLPELPASVTATRTP